MQQEYKCKKCGTKYIAAEPECPNGCMSTQKSLGKDMLRKTMDDDSDLRKSD